MRTAEIRAANVCLTVSIEGEQGQIRLQDLGKRDCSLPCRLDNLASVLKGVRYHMTGDGVSATLERDKNSVRLSLRHGGFSEFYTMPLAAFEHALRALGAHTESTSKNAYLS